MLLTPEVYNRILSHLPKAEVEYIQKLNNNPALEKTHETEDQKEQIMDVRNAKEDSDKEENISTGTSENSESMTSKPSESSLILDKIEKLQSDVEDIKNKDVTHNLTNVQEESKVGNLVPQSNGVSNVSKRKKFLCEICGKSFASKYSKTRHVLNLHQGFEKPKNEQTSSVKPSENKDGEQKLNEANVKALKRRIDEDNESTPLPSKLQKTAGQKRKMRFEEESPVKRSKNFEVWGE